MNQTVKVSLAIFLVSDSYEVHEDPVSLFKAPDTKALSCSRRPSFLNF